MRLGLEPHLKGPFEHIQKGFIQLLLSYEHVLIVCLFSGWIFKNYLFMAASGLSFIVGVWALEFMSSVIMTHGVWRPTAWRILVPQSGTRDGIHVLCIRK